MRTVAVVVQDGVEPFGLGAMCEVWAEPYHPEDDNPVFDFVVCTPRPGRLLGASGFDLHVEHGLDAAADADLVCFSPKRDWGDPSPAAAELARASHDRGAHVFAHCTASFILGEAGLLDGRECTTHWRHTDELAARFPEAKVKPEVLYVEDDRVVTGAGSAAGIDAALHLMRSEFGAKVAADAARRIVLAPHRDGGQAQFIRQPMPECTAGTLSPLLTWIIENLDSDLSVETLAARSAMSQRTFARRFVDETGATPHGWITAQRVGRAETLLEGSDLPVERIAHRVGFASAATLRHQFTKVRGISPQEYRRRFSCT
ncbi:MAG: helix-turn-helix domain-containing protein [Actinomycetota bacterium]|nr:helix-turn-helix domain-containing protein [Actinomycetota bacterium]